MVASFGTEQANKKHQKVFKKLKWTFKKADCPKISKIQFKENFKQKSKLYTFKLKLKKIS